MLSNRVLAASEIIAWAVEQEVIDVSPCDKLKPVGSEVSRDRVLSDRELALSGRPPRALAIPSARSFA